MTLRAFVAGSAAAAIVGWAIWLAILNWLDPVAAGWLGFVLFFLALFLATASTAALAGYGVRRLFFPQGLPARSVRPALRQGVWLALFLDILLFLQFLRLLRWWLGLIIVILFLSVEFIFLGYDRNQKNRRSGAGSQEQLG